MVNDYTKKWLQKALNDLKVMHNERNVEAENRVAEAVCFHAQQAVEKLLKAYLVQHDIEFGKTHNLKILLKLCRDHDPDFKVMSVGDLTDYAVEVRYPDDFYVPTLEEADESIGIADAAKVFILQKLGVSGIL